MEFFHGVNVDWMGKTKYFVALSLILLVVGWISIFTASLRIPRRLYGIDFRGGTLGLRPFCRHASDRSRFARDLQQAGLPNSTIQDISDTQNVSSKNDVVIGLEQKPDAMSRSTPASRRSSTSSTRPSARTSAPARPDFNSITASALAADLTQKDPLSLGTNAGDRYNQLAHQLADARDKDHGGIVTNFDELKSVAGVTPAVLSSLASSYSLGTFRDTRRGDRRPQGRRAAPPPGYSGQLSMPWAACWCILRFRFEWVYGAAAVIAVFHDVLITLGFFSLFHYEISLTVIAALLTLVGYSMNDTIVIFDRVRENLRLMRRESFTDIVNKSINQTLSRTILTSGLTFLTVLVLYLMGGEVLRAFSFAMVVGVVVGTYSSFGIAAPIVVLWNKYHGGQGSTVRAGSAAGKRATAAARS